jgi:hypothetical protein
VSLRPGRFTSGNDWIGGWLNPRTGLDVVEKRKLLILPGFELQPIGRPAGSQSLYRLRYPGAVLSSLLLKNRYERDDSLPDDHAFCICHH